MNDIEWMHRTRDKDYRMVIQKIQDTNKHYEALWPIARRLNSPVAMVATANSQSSCEFMNRTCVPFGTEADDNEALLAQAPEPTGSEGCAYPTAKDLDSGTTS